MIGKPCKHQGCPAIVHGKEKYCDKHKAEHPEPSSWGPRYEGRNPLYDTRKWRALRKWKLSASPICERCRRAPAEDVHHVKPVREFPELALALDNLEALCKRCHAKEVD